MKTYLYSDDTQDIVFRGKNEEDVNAQIATLELKGGRLKEVTDRRHAYVSRWSRIASALMRKNLLDVKLDAPHPPIFPLWFIRFAIGLVMLLNLADAYCTVWFIETLRVMSEDAVVMGWVLGMGGGAIPFIMLKTALVTLGCYVIWSHPHSRFSQLGTYICFILYSAVLLQFYAFALQVG